ncbi:MAG: hypothetical protein IT348_01945 [Candidatus Eisenbacteria bacterium]|nr:hypothetical protein [Candidatus Eisenbacteria bacterium]
MSTPRSLARVLAPAAFAAGLAALYAGVFSTGFLNDDYLFLEDARLNGWGSLFGDGGALANYFRPLSREVYFALMEPLSRFGAWPYRAVNFALFLASCALLFRLLRSQAGEAGAWAGTLWFALLPLQRVNLIWISCNQDLLALLGTLAAFAAWRGGHIAWAAVAWMAALLSKESALPLPAALVAWDVLVERRTARDSLRRALPLAAPLLLWAAGEWSLRHGNPDAALLQPGLPAFAATLLHLAQSLAGLDAPQALAEGVRAARPSLLALVPLAAVALAWPAASEQRARRAPLLFALVWLVAFAIPVVPVAYTWSAYYFTLAAVGGAMLVALAFARWNRWGRWGYLAALLAQLQWHAIAIASPAFAVADDIWGWTGHLTAHYFERGAKYGAQMRTALLRVEPSPAKGTRFFFATLPSWAGFQMGNGPGIRDLYRDPTLQSWFYSQFSESTAAGQPCVFLFWNGVDFERLYGRNRDPFFQVGTDLLLLDRPANAVWAFRRALDAGETSQDVLPWMGWAYLWSGDRGRAEAAWTAFGAQDDTTMHVAWLRAARTALDAGDTTATRRALFEAMRMGIGRPEAHAVLGDLLRGRSPKFALLETKVATRLNPADWIARRELVLGLLTARLDAQAEQELEVLRRIHPNFTTDIVCAQLERELSSRRPSPRAGGAVIAP